MSHYAHLIMLLCVYEGKYTWRMYVGIYIYIYIYVKGTKFRLRKRWRGSDSFIVIRDSGMDVGGCADELQCFQCTCAVVFLLEDQSRQL